MPSSVIRHYRYDARKRELAVTFVSGRTYVYLEVTELVFEEMKIASSKGRFFNTRIRPHYNFERRDLENATQEREPASTKVRKVTE